MKKIINSSIIVVIVCLIVIAGFWLFKNFAQPVKSALTDNVSGYAWSETIGWLSFNCTDQGTCGSSNYGVNLNTDNGKFSGYAWSENIGWISFNESDLSGCPQSPCRAEVASPGQLGKSNVNLKGWARALAYGGGWDGWIRFDHGQSNEPYIDTNGNWYGWAWAGGDTNGQAGIIGWLSFNCADQGICSSSNYKVIADISQPPTATNLLTTRSDPCQYPLFYSFVWTYSDPDKDNESRFDFQVDNISNFSSPEVNRSYTNLSNPSPSQNTQAVIVYSNPVPDSLLYNTAYYWRVKVYDAKGADSGWVNGSSFTTPPNPYPIPDFTWLPNRPATEEEVQFTDKTTTFGGATIIIWSWTFQDANPASSNQQNPKTIFTSSGQKSVNLRVTDSINNTCDVTKPVRVSFPLPKWKEVKP